MTTSIRRLVPADSPAYREIRLTSLAEFPASFGSSFEEENQRDDSEFEQSIDSSARTAFVRGAFDGDSLVGICRFQQEGWGKTRHRGGLQSMYVRPACAGRGIGRLLVQQAVAEAFADPAIQLIMLGVVADNAAANRLYESLEFEEYGRLPNYLLVNGTSYTMRFMALQRPAASSETSS